jgi:diguanylate cyclase (GGDEF)-like protein
MMEDDQALITSMVDAVFDRGFYQEIAVFDLNGRTIVNRQQRFLAKEAPLWFVRLVELKTPQGKSLITKGWTQRGRIEVISHPGHAYADLWRISVQAFWLIVLIGIASYILVVWVVRRALAPLSDMEALAMSISNRQFLTLGKIPWARELRSVTTAMNTMSQQVKVMLEEVTDLSEKMRLKAYVDEVSGLANRRYFDEQLDHLLKTPEEFSGGPLLLVYLQGFKEFNDRSGSSIGDQLLKETGDLITGICRSYERALVARTKGVEFGLLIPNLMVEEVDSLGEALIRSFQEIHDKFNTSKELLIKVGATYVQADQSSLEALTAAEGALNMIKDKKVDSWVLASVETLAAAKETFEDRQQILASPNLADIIFLQFQPVETCSDRQVLNTEVLARLTAPDGTSIPAGAFLHQAKLTGRIPEIDRQVVNLVLSRMARAEYPFPHKAAINLSLASLQDQPFIDWLHTRLRQNPREAQKLIFEMNEAALNTMVVHQDTIQKIQDTGAMFAVDNYGHSAAAIGYLKKFFFDYIKIDASFIRQIHLKDDAQFFVQTLVGIAHGLGIRVVAGFVETQEEFETIQKMKVDGAQGYFIAKPR